MSDIPEFRADGVRVLVTGATSGLGAAMAAALVDAGARVAVTGRDPERAHRVAEALGTAAVGVGMDVRDEDDVARGVTEAADRLRGLARVCGAGPAAGARRELASGGGQRGPLRTTRR